MIDGGGGGQTADSTVHAKRFLYNPFTLTFKSPFYELDFSIDQFYSMYPIHIACALLISLTYVVIKGLNQIAPEYAAVLNIVDGAPFAYAFVFLIFRTLVHQYYMDRRRAYSHMHTLHVVVVLLSRWAHILVHAAAACGVEAAIGQARIFVEEAAVPRTVVEITCRTIIEMVLPIFCHAFPTNHTLGYVIYISCCLHEYCEAPGLSEWAAYCLTILAGAIIGHTLELQSRTVYIRRHEILATAANSRRADSRLNHVLKNKSAEARYLVGEVADGLKTIKQAVERGQMDKIFVARLLDSLALVQYIHEQTVEWTHMRELFMQIQHKTYPSMRTPTDIPLLLRRVFGDDPSQTKLEFPGRGILSFDGDILRLQLEEGRSNALKYRQPDSKLYVRAVVEQASAYDTSWLHVTLDNRNKDELPALSPAECAAAFAPGHRCENIGERSPGDGIGLDNVAASASAVGGKAWLSTYVHPDDGAVHTVFHVTQPCEVPSEAQMKAVRAATRMTATKRVTTLRQDDSSVKSDEMSQPSSGTSSNQYRRFSAISGQGQQHLPLCLGMDDSETLQMLLQSIFQKLGASPESRALGSSVEEQESFIPLALGDEDGPPADIVVLDQNLNLPGVKRPEGTEVARQLVESGFQGLIAIHSGLSRQELEELQSLPFVHTVITKGHSVERLAAELSEAYARHRNLPSRRRDSEAAGKLVGTVGATAAASGARAAEGEPTLSPSMASSFTNRESSFTSSGERSHELSCYQGMQPWAAAAHPPTSAADAEGAANADTTTGVAGAPSPTMEGAFSLADLTTWKVDLSHLEGFTQSQIQRIIQPFYDVSSPRSGERMIAQLKHMLDNGQPTADLAHRLRGDAKTSGADGLSELALDFQHAPTVDKIEVLRVALKGTIARMKTDGVLP